MSQAAALRGVLACMLAVGLCGSVPAQELPVSALDRTLQNLKEGVARLALDNSELTAANDRLRERLKLMNEGVEALRRNEVRVLEELKQLEAQESRRSGGGSGAEKRLKALEEQYSRLAEEQQALELSASIKDKADRQTSESLEAVRQETESLRMSSEVADESVSGADDVRRQQQDLEAAAESAEASLQSARETLKELELIYASGPQGLDAARKISLKLSEQLAARQAEVVALEAEIAAEESALRQFKAGPEFNSAYRAEIEQSVNGYRQRITQLEQEQKRQSRQQAMKQRKMAAASSVEYRKQEARLRELERKNQDLRREMDRLRRLMVEQDRKKVSLEAQLYGK